MIYVIFKKHDHDQWPTFDIPSHGMKTTNTFTSRDKAETFMAGMKMGPEWEACELPAGEFPAWLEQNREAGVTHVVFDCNPTDRGHKMKPLGDVMAGLADDRDGPCAYCGKTCRAIGQQLNPTDLPVFDTATLNRTAVWCEACRKVCCGACLGPGQQVTLGNCPKCGGATAFARKDQWAGTAVSPQPPVAPPAPPRPEPVLIREGISRMMVDTCLKEILRLPPGPFSDQLALMSGMTMASDADKAQAAAFVEWMLRDTAAKQGEYRPDVCQMRELVGKVKALGDRTKDAGLGRPPAAKPTAPEPTAGPTAAPPPATPPSARPTPTAPSGAKKKPWWQFWT